MGRLTRVTKLGPIFSPIHPHWFDPGKPMPPVEEIRTRKSRIEEWWTESPVLRLGRQPWNDRLWQRSEVPPTSSARLVWPQLPSFLCRCPDLIRSG